MFIHYNRTAAVFIGGGLQGLGNPEKQTVSDRKVKSRENLILKSMRKVRSEAPEKTFKISSVLTYSRNEIFQYNLTSFKGVRNDFIERFTIKQRIVSG